MDVEKEEILNKLDNIIMDVRLLKNNLGFNMSSDEEFDEIVAKLIEVEKDVKEY